jgi:hypothetical protein
MLYAGKYRFRLLDLLTTMLHRPRIAGADVFVDAAPTHHP